ncbi:olfactory receptor 142-like [Electrophorus electricus]|uniref:olfactory receptor 142-like n=1 Tax=Electrophorus electricus TaxID=8005 RepID=UPI000F0A7527|nr:olfactory receptor 142-like [Electrophorus electricus]
MDNISTVTLLFTALNESDRMSRLTIFAFTLTGFLTTVILNFMLILIIVIEKPLHKPMYIFLCNLCVNGLCGTVAFYPKVLYDLTMQISLVSIQECIVQSYAIFIYGIGEFTNLSIMSLDRYLAICRPLYYHTVMTHVTVLKLIMFIWMFPCCTTLVIILMEARNPICGQYVNKLYCGSFHLETLACNAHISEIIIKWIFFCLLNILVSFVFLSYAKIIIACKRSKLKQNKFMSTCVPHLISFSNFMALSLLDATHTQFKLDIPQMLQNFNSAVFLIFPPVVNPIIYGIKLSPIRTQIILFVQRLLFNVTYNSFSFPKQKSLK